MSTRWLTNKPIDPDIDGGRAHSLDSEPRDRRSHRLWWRYVRAALLVLAGSLLGSLMHRVLAPTNLVMIYLLVVVVAAMYLGRGLTILAAILGVLLFAFLFVPPYLTLAVNDTEYVLTFLALVIVGLIISDLTARVREQM